MPDLLAQLIPSVILNSAVTGAIVWISRAWISERLKNSIRHEYDQKLETHRAQLLAQSAVETEKLRTQLSILSTEHAVRFQRLHEQRADVIAELYGLLVEAQWKAEQFASPIGRGSDPSKREQFHDSINQFAKFYQFFEKQKIYLPPDLCAQIEEFVKAMRAKVIGFGVYTHHDEQHMPDDVNRRMQDAWSEAHDYLSKQVPAARETLEDAFRAILDGGSADPTTQSAHGSVLGTLGERS